MDRIKLTILEIFGVTAAGWAVSLSEVESIARIVSLVVPTIISILLYQKNRKNGSKKDK